MDNFSAKVKEAVKNIPAGKCLSYKQVAELAGKPRAWRAVGNILNKNYDPAVPCHRVVLSNGKTGGYNRGGRKKAELLAGEGWKRQTKPKKQFKRRSEKI
jgi:methylated-DNA-[protein]-cysteine S-methyltransferase